MSKINHIAIQISSGLTPLRSNSEFWNKREIPWLKTEQLGDFIITDTNEYISKKALDATSIKLFPKNTVSVAMYGEGKTRGNVSILGREMCTNQACCNIVVDDKKANYKYVYYWLKNSYITLRNLAAGVRKNLNSDDIKNFDIELKTRDEQDKISNLLYSLDMKIRNNNRINAELESMAKTLYEYWFMQFEFPNEDGKPYKSSSGKMVWNEELKREIPDGWVVENLMETSLCEDIKAGVDYFDTKNYLPTANINGENITDGEYITYYNRENRANMQPVKYSVWFAKMKNSIKHLTIPNNSDWFIEKYILSTGFQGLKCSADSLSFIHCIVNSGWFEDYKDVLSHGATQEGVNNEDLKNIKFAVPSNRVLKQFSKIVLPAIQRKFSIINENQELTAIRDFLLPLLMNGQVTFKEEKL